VRFKLDENLGKQIAEILRESGYDVATVPDQKMWGTNDNTLIETCSTERRCLITLDMEFGNPLLFKPADYSGIIVLRLPSKPTPQDLLDLAGTLVKTLGQKDIGGKLWVVQRGRVREYQPEDEDL
jgi:predicted nuclease of predicted toxin-antitoxin system